MPSQPAFSACRERSTPTDLRNNDDNDAAALARVQPKVKHLIHPTVHASKSPAPQPSVLTSAASQLKRSPTVAQHSPNTTVNNRPGLGNRVHKPVAEHDPENHEIKRLRDEGLNWAEIVQEINNQRVKTGRLPNLTENAVYLRYMRNAPRIAAANGETWSRRTRGTSPTDSPSSDANNVSPSVSVNRRPRKRKRSRDTATRKMAAVQRDLEATAQFTPEQDELLVRVHKEVLDETWETVSRRIVDRGGPKFDPETCARRYSML